MNDLISRQAAIDAIERLQMPIMRSQDNAEQFKFTGMAEAREAIIGLPSAQPEIITCKDCEWWEKQKDSAQGRCELMQMYPTGGWYCGNAQRRVTDGGLD